MELCASNGFGECWFARKEFQVGDLVLEESAAFFSAPAYFCADMEPTLPPVAKSLLKLSQVFSTVFFKDPKNNDIAVDEQAVTGFVSLLVSFVALPEAKRSELLKSFYCPVGVSGELQDRNVDGRHPLIRLVRAFAIKVVTLVPEFKSANIAASDVERFLLIMMSNATESMRLETHGAKKPPHLHPYVTLYSGLAKFAHSCSPNCSVLNDPERGELVRVYALKPIKSGDVLSISYMFAGDDIRAILPTRIRQRELYYKKLFLCLCVRCADTDYLRTRTCIHCDTLAAAQPHSANPVSISAAHEPLSLVYDEVFRCSSCAKEFTLDARDSELEYEVKVEELSYRASAASVSAEVTSIIDMMHSLQRRIQGDLGKAHWCYQWLSPYVAMKLSFSGKALRKPKELSMASNLIGSFLVFADDRIGQHSPQVMSRWALSNIKFLDTPVDVQILINVAQSYKSYQRETFSFTKAHQEALDAFCEKAQVTLDKIKSQTSKQAPSGDMLPAKVLK